MKKNSFITSLLSFTALSISANATLPVVPNQNTDNNIEQNINTAQEETWRDSIKTINDAFQSFGFELFSAVDKSASKNVVFSPFSVQHALCMLMNGAKDNTLAEMKEMMKISDYSLNTINELNRDTRTKIESLTDIRSVLDETKPYNEYNPATRPDTSICTRVANGIWTMKGREFKEEFLNTNKSFYDAEVKSIDLASQDDITEHIDRWIKEKTNNTIKSSGIEANELLSMVIANALYFKGKWTSQFNKGDTKDDQFTNYDGSLSTIPMMHKEETLTFYEGSKFNAIKMNYGHGNISMGIFLDRSDEFDCGNLELTKEEWESYMNCKNKQPINIAMPKFKIDIDVKLKEILTEMGMKDAFTNAASFDLAKNSDSKSGPVVGDIKQKAYISVDEEGTEASAVTIIILIEKAEPNTEKPKDFIINRPFYFTIEDNTTNTLLFAGHIKSLGGPSASAISETSTSPARNATYDLQGRKLQNTPQRGMYICNGKKYVRF